VRGGIRTLLDTGRNDPRSSVSQKYIDTETTIRHVFVHAAKTYSIAFLFVHTKQEADNSFDAYQRFVLQQQKLRLPCMRLWHCNKPVRPSAT
jgi:hypothetical protein